MDNFRKIIVPLSLFYVLIFDQFFKAASYGSFVDPCQTPEGDILWCVNKTVCKPILDVLEEYPEPVPPRVGKVLKEYYSCENTSLVCCPEKPIHIHTPPPLPLPPNVTGHKNLKLLPAEECGLINLSDRIRGGEDADLYEFPWMALLSFNTSNGPQFQCGGTIISERYILTAAHCLVGTKFPVVGVRVGEYDLASDKDCHETVCLPLPQDLPIERIIAHPEFNRTSLFADDIGLLRVSKIDIARTYPICLPIFEEIKDKKFENGVVTGWGFTNPNRTTSTGVLQKVRLPARELSVCKEAYRSKPWIKPSHKQWCIGGTGLKDSCQGDSGGPLQVAHFVNGDNRYIQHGIVSQGPTYCGSKDYPGLYTKLSYYMKWILDNIEP